MTDIVIKAENLGKKYFIGHQAERSGYTTLREVLMQNTRNLWNKTKDLAMGKPIIQGDTLEEVWAIENMFFDIRCGDAVGIIGRNGAGKSTLLKVLSRITEPSAGRVTIKGRVASLLEVGTGFHPELTGRENIYLNGTILGMTRKEIKQKFDEIIDFAEVEKYLDTPVKRYSSGMYVRLAFAVAAHLEPEILLVDEVLAVGDAAFQKKCLGKMGDVAKEGRTVLFVSHNMDAIRRLCSRCFLIQGRILKDDQPSNVINFYTDDIIRKTAEYSQAEEKSKRINLRRVVLLDAAKKIKSEFEYQEGFILHIEYEINEPVKSCIVWLAVWTVGGTEVLVTADYDMEPELLNERKPGYYQTEINFPGNLLNAGNYYIVVGIASYTPVAMSYDRVEAVYLSVIDLCEYPIAEGATRSGIVKTQLKWKTENH